MFTSPEQETTMAVYAAQARLLVSGLFDDQQRIKIREICQSVLDDRKRKK